MKSPTRPIATINEGPLHAALKQWYAQPGDLVEVPMHGRQIDLVRGELLIEIQTAGFSALRKKLPALLERRPVRLVHPVAVQRWIVRVEGRQLKVLGRRKSPKQGRLEDAFSEIVSLSQILSHPNFSLEILLTHEDEVRRHVPNRAWRRKGWVTAERRLISVVSSHVFGGPRDFLRLLPATMPKSFTTLDVAEQLSVPRGLAQKIAYCLRFAGAIRLDGKRGNAMVYRMED